MRFSAAWFWPRCSRRALRRTVAALMVMAALGLLVYCALGYLVHTTNPKTGRVRDGLGRRMVSAPDLMLMVCGVTAQWAGWRWFFVDVAVIFGSLVGIYVLYLVYEYLVEAKRSADKNGTGSRASDVPPQTRHRDDAG